MSTYAQFLSGGGGGAHTNNPRQLSRVANSSSSTVMRQQNTEVLSNVAQFFTNLTAQLDTDWVADTFKTVVSISSGSGFVSAMVGPVPPSTSAITFRVEVDGVTTDIAFPSVSGTTHRPILGRVRNRSASATDPRDLFSDIHNGTTNVGSGVQTVTASGGQGVMVLTPVQCHLSGAGMLRFERSFSLQMKGAVANTVTTAFERRCGVLYTLE
jgi:hypothetical protein